MATAQVSPEFSKPSFAKIAASTKETQAPDAVLRLMPNMADATPRAVDAPIVVGAPVIANGGVGKSPARPGPVPASTGESSSSASRRTPDRAAGVVASSSSSRTKDQPVDLIAVGSKTLHVGPRAPSLVVNGTGVSMPEKKTLVRGVGGVVFEAGGSDESLKADSASDLGTKPPSLDGKSITSGTTFALDEKESLRPDDSASVKAAAAEDDDTFSLHNSIAVGSRMGSDIAARVRAIQLGDMGRQPSQTTSGLQGIVTPQSTSSENQPIASVAGAPDALNTIYRQAPDEKLIEAMHTPNNRIFLLRLEKQVMDFVQQSKEPFIDLPPCNSFCRMLTHKLADYYHMTHSFEQSVMSVRIFRTPFCRVPPSLASLVESASATSTPPPSRIQKIIRRGEDCEIGPSSRGASKPASEDGSDGKEKQASQPTKMTREQREEAYRAARTRIFGTEEEGPEIAGDDENGSSRPSSGLKDKGQTKPRRQGRWPPRNPNMNFEGPQPQFAPFYPQGPPPPGGWPVGHPGQAPFMPVVPQGPQFNGQMPMYSNAPQMQGPAGYGPGPVPGPMGVDPNFAPMPNVPYGPYGAMPQYQQPSAQRFPSNGSGGATFSPTAPASPHQGAWQQQQPAFVPGSPYQSRGAVPNTQVPIPVPAPSPIINAGGGPTSGPASTGIPYAFGQLPVHVNPHDPKSQHPIPGSYNRHAFNPSTKSFVPGNGMAGPMQGSQPPAFSGPPGSHHSSPQFGSPHLAYPASGYQSPMAAPTAMPGQGYGPPASGYAMTRQGSNTSLGPFYQPNGPAASSPLATTAQLPQPNTHHLPAHPPPQIPNKPPVPQGPGQQQFSHLPPHYGNPASLPAKPT